MASSCAVLAIAVVVALIIIAAHATCNRAGPMASPGGGYAGYPWTTSARDTFKSLIPPKPEPARFPSSCAPFNPNAIAHEMEQPLLYRCQHQCETLGPVTERPGGSCVEQCVWGWKDPPPGMFSNKYGDGRGDPWPRKSCGVTACGADYYEPHIITTDDEWPIGVDVNNVWTGSEFAPPEWQKCFKSCGMDLVCRDDCLSTAAGTAYGL